MNCLKHPLRNQQVPRSIYAVNTSQLFLQANKLERDFTPTPTKFCSERKIFHCTLQ
jgi:hypothetical protein